MDRQTLVFIIIMFILFSIPNNGDEPHSAKNRETLLKFKESIEYQREILNNQTYEMGYGNITGFELSYEDHINGRNISEWPIHKYTPENPWSEDQKYSIIPNKVRDAITSFWGLNKVNINDDGKNENNDINGLGNAYLLNISGKAWGEFENKAEQFAIPKVNLKLPTYLQEYADENSQNKRNEEEENFSTTSETDTPNYKFPDWEESDPKTGNITFPSGSVRILFENEDYIHKNPKYKEIDPDLKVDNAVKTELQVNFRDHEQKEFHVLYLDGIYYQDTGSVFASTISGKFLSGFTLPHLCIYKEKFEVAKKIRNINSLSMKDSKDFSMDKLNSAVLAAVELCEYVGYFQLQKTNYSVRELREIDEELLNPSGRPITSNIPSLEIEEFLMYSPDCGIVLQSEKKKPLSGPIDSVFNYRVKHLLEILLLLVAIQIFFFVRQMKAVRTPGQLSNISSSTLSLLLYQDALNTMITFFTANLYNRLYLLPACLSIVAFINVIFEFSFTVKVLSNQVNENGISWWELLRSSTARNLENESENESSSINNNTPIIPNAIDDNPQMTETRISNRVYVRASIISLMFLFIVLNFVDSSVSVKRTVEWIGLPIINSYWIFQFLRNTLRNRKKAFLWEFMIGISVIRLIAMYYFFVYKNNVLRHTINIPLSITVTCWVGIQLSLIWLQNKLGPRFWINDKWLPKAYDYHPILNVSDLENGFSTDILANIREMEQGNENSLTVNCKVDCAICMTDVEFPVRTKPDAKDGLSTIERAKIQQCMITPCHHIFHSECLEDWMKYKLQCPVCRNSLPPV